MVLITKDVLMPGYLPTYGNQYWQTPNIDELAQKGTVFRRHYTVAPSTAMAFTSMFTGKLPYQLDRRKYEHVDDLAETETLFGILEKNGYENHILWSKNYLHSVLPFSNCYGSDRTVFHNLDLNQVIGPHMARYTKLERNIPLEEKTIGAILHAVDEIFSTNGTIFLWMHLPHVLRGRIAYGDDIDLFDRIVGHVRTYAGDEHVFISADHGHMNGTHNTFGYGFDVYEPAIRIPLIAPRLEQQAYVDFPTSNARLSSILLDRRIPKDEYVFADSAYYAQPHRKLAIIKNNFKYIYNKATDSEELYDLLYDPVETINMLRTFHTDKNRRLRYCVRDVHFNPHWDIVPELVDELRSVKQTIWRKGNFREESYAKTKRMLSVPYHQVEWIWKGLTRSKP